MNDELIREIMIGQKPLKNTNELLLKKEIIILNKEIERLHSIIKEVREWEKDLYYECISGSKHNKLLEILDKVNK